MDEEDTVLEDDADEEFERMRKEKIRINQEKERQRNLEEMEQLNYFQRQKKHSTSVRGKLTYYNKEDSVAPPVSNVWENRKKHQREIDSMRPKSAEEEEIILQQVLRESEMSAAKEEASRQRFKTYEKRCAVQMSLKYGKSAITFNSEENQPQCWGFGKRKAEFKLDEDNPPLPAPAEPMLPTLDPLSNASNVWTKKFAEKTVAMNLCSPHDDSFQKNVTSISMNNDDLITDGTELPQSENESEKRGEINNWNDVHRSPEITQASSYHEEKWDEEEIIVPKFKQCSYKGYVKWQNQLSEQMHENQKAKVVGPLKNSTSLESTEIKPVKNQIESFTEHLDNKNMATHKSSCETVSSDTNMDALSNDDDSSERLEERESGMVIKNARNKEINLLDSRDLKMSSFEISTNATNIMKKDLNGNSLNIRNLNQNPITNAESDTHDISQSNYNFNNVSASMQSPSVEWDESEAIGCEEACPSMAAQVPLPETSDSQDDKPNEKDPYLGDLPPTPQVIPPRMMYPMPLMAPLPAMGPFGPIPNLPYPANMMPSPTANLQSWMMTAMAYQQQLEYMSRMYPTLFLQGNPAAQVHNPFPLPNLPVTQAEENQISTPVDICQNNLPQSDQENVVPSELQENSRAQAEKLCEDNHMLPSCKEDEENEDNIREINKSEEEEGEDGIRLLRRPISMYLPPPPPLEEVDDINSLKHLHISTNQKMWKPTRSRLPPPPKKLNELKKSKTISSGPSDANQRKESPLKSTHNEIASSEAVKKAAVKESLHKYFATHQKPVRGPEFSSSELTSVRPLDGEFLNKTDIDAAIHDILEKALKQKQRIKQKDQLSTSESHNWTPKASEMGDQSHHENVLGNVKQTHIDLGNLHLERKKREKFEVEDARKERPA